MREIHPWSLSTHSGTSSGVWLVAGPWTCTVNISFFVASTNCGVAECCGLLDLLNRILSLVTKGLQSDSSLPLALDKVAYLLVQITQIWSSPLPFLGAFAKLRRANVGFVMSVRPTDSPPVCLCTWKKLGSFWTDFHEIWYLKVFRKCA